MLAFLAFSLCLLFQRTTPVVETDLAGSIYIYIYIIAFVMSSVLGDMLPRTTVIRLP